MSAAAVAAAAAAVVVQFQVEVVALQAEVGAVGTVARVEVDDVDGRVESAVGQVETAVDVVVEVEVAVVVCSARRMTHSHHLPHNDPSTLDYCYLHVQDHERYTNSVPVCALRRGL